MATLKEVQNYLVDIARESAKKFQYLTAVIHRGDDKDDYIPGHMNTNVLREAQKWFSIYLKGDPVFAMLGSNLRQLDKYGNPQWDLVKIHPRGLESKLKKDLEKIRSKTMVKGWEQEEGYEYSPDDPHNQVEWMPTQNMTEEVQRIRDFGNMPEVSPDSPKVSPISPAPTYPLAPSSPYGSPSPLRQMAVAPKTMSSFSSSSSSSPGRSVKIPFASIMTRR